MTRHGLVLGISLCNMTYRWLATGDCVILKMDPEEIIYVPGVHFPQRKMDRPQGPYFTVANRPPCGKWTSHRSIYHWGVPLPLWNMDPGVHFPWGSIYNLTPASGICPAATWTTNCVFARHYHLDLGDPSSFRMHVFKAATHGRPSQNQRWNHVVPIPPFGYSHSWDWGRHPSTQ